MTSCAREQSLTQRVSLTTLIGAPSSVTAKRCMIPASGLNSRCEKTRMCIAAKSAISTQRMKSFQRSEEPSTSMPGTAATRSDW